MVPCLNVVSAKAQARRTSLDLEPTVANRGLKACMSSLQKRAHRADVFTKLKRRISRFRKVSFKVPSQTEVDCQSSGYEKEPSFGTGIVVNQPSV